MARNHVEVRSPCTAVQLSAVSMNSKSGATQLPIGRSEYAVGAFIGVDVVGTTEGAGVVGLVEPSTAWTGQSKTNATQRGRT